jgi:co-chaperonin GroES (HSP10)
MEENKTKMEENKTTPVFKSVPFGRLLITANLVTSSSGIILNSKDNAKPMIRDVQKVVSVGLNATEAAGISVKVGDGVLLNTANPRLGQPVFFDKLTGEYAQYAQAEKDCDMYLLIEAREVLMVL